MKILLKHFAMNYQKEGTGPVLILLHGNGENHHIFDEALPVLCKHFTVYALDSRGHGRSKCKVSAYHYQEMAEDVFEFISLLSLTNVSIYGFSDGGIIALLLSIAHPECVKKLTISGSNINPLGLIPKCLHRIQKEYDHATSLEEKKLCLLMLNEPNIQINDLKKISCPTLILVGEDDVVRLDHTLLIHQNIKNSTLLILPNETHESYITHSSKFCDYLIPFINK